MNRTLAHWPALSALLPRHPPQLRLPALPALSPTLLPAVLPALLLALLCLLQITALLRAPAVAAPERIAITLAPGAALTVGRAALAAPQAAQSHLALRRDGAGRWWVANASGSHRLILHSAGQERDSGAAVLQAGQRFDLGGARFAVDGASARAVSFSGPGGHWRYDGTRLLRDGAAQPPCADGGAGARLAGWWNMLAPAALGLARPLVFGGNLYCGNRIGIAGVAPHAATLAPSAHGLQLRGAVGVALTMASTQAAHAPATLARQELPLDGVTALVAGHTRLAASIDGDTLTLRPSGHVSWVPGDGADAAAAALPPQVRWQLRARSWWTLPAGPAWRVGAVLAAGLLASLLLVRQGGAPLGTMHALPVIGSALLAIAGVTTLLLQRAGTPVGAGWSLLLGCAALWCLLLAARTRLVTCAAVLLLATGLLSQLEMGLGAQDASWLRHYQKSCALLAIGLGASVHLLLRWRARRGVAGPAVSHTISPAYSQTRLEWLFALLAAVALAALAAQVLVGDETGVFDLQPVELAKLALTVLTSHCLAIGMGWQQQEQQQQQQKQQKQRRSAAGPRWRRWCRLGAPALLFAALLGLALLEVDDYSPLILLLVWATAMAFAWALAARAQRALAAIGALALLAAGAIAWLRLAGAGDIAGWTFYADRFLVWLDPASHPHTGQQLLQAARAIADGGWWGADGMSGLRSLGQDAGAALRIPQVQDDFAPSFFLHRHGLAAALALWLLQALFLAGVLHAALHAHRAASAARNFRQAWLGRFCCFALCGGAAFVLGHLLLSWGTNLAIFPIMGQPMSFLSAGGSHLLFFLCPLLAFTVFCAHQFEEKPSCPSMSNTRC